MKKIFFVLTICLFFIPALALAHPGRTDAYGCHTCRTNCAKWGLSTGEYHCHQTKSLPQPKEPIKSHKSDTGAGYTTPAPEYKVPKIELTLPAVPKTETKVISVESPIGEKDTTTAKAFQNIQKTNQTGKVSIFKEIFRMIFGN